jgi:hypothetical protein
MATDPTKLDDLEMLSLLAHGLIPYMGRVATGEKDPFPYPDTLLCGFNQLILTCALRDVPRAQRPKSIPEFVATWATLPLAEWNLKLDISADVFTTGARLLDPECDGSPTALCRKLSRGEVIPRTAKGATIADRTANPKAIA